MQPLLASFAEAGGFAGLGALLGVIITALQSHKKLDQMSEQTKQLVPDHGTSLADRLQRVEEKVDMLADVLKSQGHQIGEIRTDSHQIHAILDKRIERLEAVDDRLGFLK